MSVAEVKAALHAVVDPQKAAFYPRFFKAGKGEYAEGDRFIGVVVPQQRRVAFPRVKVGRSRLIQGLAGQCGG